MIPKYLNVRRRRCEICDLDAEGRYDILTLDCGYGTHISDCLQNGCNKEGMLCRWCGQYDLCIVKELTGRSAAMVEAEAWSFEAAPGVLHTPEQMNRAIATYLLNYKYFSRDDKNAADEEKESSDLQLVYHRVASCGAVNDKK